MKITTIKQNYYNNELDADNGNETQIDVDMGRDGWTPRDYLWLVCPLGVLRLYGWISEAVRFLNTRVSV